MLAHPLHAKGFFLPEINGFSSGAGVVGCLCLTEGDGRHHGPLLPGACFDFHLGWGHGGRLTPASILTCAPIP